MSRARIHKQNVQIRRGHLQKHAENMQAVACDMYTYLGPFENSSGALKESQKGTQKTKFYANPDVSHKSFLPRNAIVESRMYLSTTPVISNPYDTWTLDESGMRVLRTK